MLNWLFGKKQEEKKAVYVTGCEFHCIQKKCPKWVIMYRHEKQKDGSVKTIEDGRCYAAWLPVLIIEQVDKILGAINGDKKKLNHTDTDNRA